MSDLIPDKGIPDMMSTKFSDLFDPLPPLSAFGSDLCKNKVENPHNGPSAILVKRVTGNNGINW